MRRRTASTSGASLRKEVPRNAQGGGTIGSRDARRIWRTHAQHETSGMSESEEKEGFVAIPREMQDSGVSGWFSRVGGLRGVKRRRASRDPGKKKKKGARKMLLLFLPCLAVDLLFGPDPRVSSALGSRTIQFQPFLLRSRPPCPFHARSGRAGQTAKAQAVSDRSRVGRRPARAPADAPGGSFGAQRSRARRAALASRWHAVSKLFSLTACSLSFFL